MKYDYLIVGAGLAGATLAENIATKLNKKVLVVEKRKHIAGNVYDLYDDAGILIHRYGPHTFHTNNKIVWDYLSRFTQWRFYQHKVKSYVDGKLVPIPINLDTVNILFDLDLNPNSMKQFIKSKQVHKETIENSEDFALSLVGKELYEKFYLNYTIKQWGKHPSELSSEVLKRIPLRYDRDDRYFTDQYQGIPQNGYTRMVENMIGHDNIDILLGVDYRELENSIEYDKLIYTGPIDEYFNYRYGRLDYLSLNFKFESYDQEFYQSCAAINYPNDYNFTRIREFKYMTGQKSPKTTILKEYPYIAHETDEKYYPMYTKENIDLSIRYKELAQTEKDTIFVGRLAEFKYYNMDQVVLRALTVFEELILGEG